MKIQIAIPLFAIALLLLGAGCASENVTWSQFPSTTFPELSLPPKASLRIVSTRDEETKKLAQRLREALAKDGKLQVVEGSEKATHLVIIHGATAFRNDTPDQARHSGRVTVETLESETGSTQRIKREQASTHTAAREISIAVYAIKTLDPVQYFSFPIYDSVSSDGMALNAVSAEAESTRIQEKFTELAVSRLEEVFSTQQRLLKVPVPVESDSELKRQFFRIEACLRAKDPQGLERALAAIDALAKRQDVIPGPLTAFAQASSAKGWEPPEGKTREYFLGNYYLVALRREIGCTDSATLSAIHDELLQILELCEEPSLRMACPIALGRLEEKLAHLRSL